MGLRSFVKGLFSEKMLGKGRKNGGFYGNLEAQIFYKEYAIESCISLIANAITLSEFTTYENGNETQKENYYRFNVEPNKNQNATEFWHHVISNLIYDNECLIIQDGTEFFVADSFTLEKQGTEEDKFTGITVREKDIPGILYMSDVFYLKLNDENIKDVIDSLYAEYGKLITSASAGYKKSNGRKGILNISAMLSQQEDMDEELQDLMDNKFKKYFESDNAVLPLSEGLEFDESQTKGNIKDTRDIKALVDDIFEFVSRGFHVPISIFRGDLENVDNQIDIFLMFCINPIAKLIANEINRKLYGVNSYNKKTYVKIDTNKIKNVDLKTLSSSADLLFRIGVNSINDNRSLLGKEKINETWADEHYVTKNYQSVLSINENAKGGETGGKKIS